MREHPPRNGAVRGARTERRFLESSEPSIRHVTPGDFEAVRGFVNWAIEHTASNFNTLIATIAFPNKASAGLHESLGFEPAGIQRRIGRKFDRWHDVGLWQYHLQAEDYVPAPLKKPEGDDALG